MLSNCFQVDICQWGVDTIAAGFTIVSNCFEVDICQWRIGTIGAEFTIVSNSFEVDIFQYIFAAGQEQINGRM